MQKISIELKDGSKFDIAYDNIEMSNGNLIISKNNEVIDIFGNNQIKEYYLYNDDIISGMCK